MRIFFSIKINGSSLRLTFSWPAWILFLVAALAFLRLTVADWSWWLVTSPLWATQGVVISMLLFFVVRNRLRRR